MMNNSHSRNSPRRAWIYFLLAMILIFIYYRKDRGAVSTLDEFSLMATGACIAFGFSALIKSAARRKED